MSMPDEILNLPYNCGVFALWCVIRQYGLDVQPQKIIELSKYNAEDGTFGIALTIALYKLGFEVSFCTDPDPDQHPIERLAYTEAEQLGIAITSPLSYENIQQEIDENQALVIVFYDDLEDVGNHSLVYSIDENEICFFDSLDAMPRDVFEQQRQAKGICRQSILIHCYQAPTYLS